MAIVDTRNQLLKEISGLKNQKPILSSTFTAYKTNKDSRKGKMLERNCNLIFTESTGSANSFKQFSTSRIFHHYCQMCGSQNHLQIIIQNSKSKSWRFQIRKSQEKNNINLLEADDVGMTKRSVVYNLSGHILINLHATQHKCQYNQSIFLLGCWKKKWK